MKLSLSWIFDHIQGDWKDLDIASFVATFNAKIAEVEHYEKISIDLAQFSIGQVTQLSDANVTVFSPEWNKEFTFNKRTDAQLGLTFLITNSGWATLRDVHADKDGLIPSLTVPDTQLNGSWKESFESEDIILEVSNTTITHRADLWSHRGFAREIAAILDLKLVSIDQLLAKQPVKHYEENKSATPSSPIAISIQDHNRCKHYAGLYVKSLGAIASLLPMACRLARVQIRPINAIVDITNYVMCDIGQPMHAFDADKLPSKTIVVKAAVPHQKVTLLDGQTLELTDQDTIISDGKQALALAGIMGGNSSAINADTESVFLEAACFDASHIRRTSTRYKIRTDSSARFEKGLDPHLNQQAIERFIKIVHDSSITMEIIEPIALVGTLTQPQTITVEYDFIESRLGARIKPDQVKTLLEKLDYGVREQQEKKKISYTITVPTFRATRDPVIKEDILEEVGRLYGYDHIKYQLPTMALKPHDTDHVYRLRSIKKHLAYSLAMHELESYGFFDDQILSRLQWYPTNAVSLKNPVSEHFKILVTSLIPGLIKAVMHNELRSDELSFFEYARIWHKGSSNTIEERSSLAGIMFKRKKDVDFYDAKQQLSSLFGPLHIDVTWRKPVNDIAIWFDEHKTAELIYEDTVIGYAGKIHKQFLNRCVDGDAFIFELDGTMLVNYKPRLKQFESLAKYPIVWLDISMLVPRCNCCSSMS